MKRRLFLVAALLSALHPALAEEPVVRLVDFDAAVTSATATRVIRAIDDAEAAGDDLVLIEMDTPGGFVEAMADIIKRMLASDVPVVVWVGPSGARAASAGFFILIAADVAAMAPGTRTGAASTIIPFGQNTDDNVVLRKANEDHAALLRSIAERRGRDVQASEDAVFSAKAYEESVALEKGLIDLLAGSREDLLGQLDGREVTLFDGTTRTLATAGATFVVSEVSARQHVMEFVGTPIVAFLLLIVGLGGLYIEFTHPGVVLPGVVGALSLILFALAAQVLPISTIGILLILLAIVMFILEIKVTSYGMLTVGGALCLIIGSTMLIEGPIPELKVPLWVVLPTVLVIVGFCALVVRLALRAHRTQVDTGNEGLIHAVGTVTQELGPEGKVFVHGEIWNATATGGAISCGVRVKVIRVEDLQLTVEPVDTMQPDRS